MGTIHENYQAAARERAELRRGDALEGPRECCGHEGRNHGPDGCCMPGCDCLWPNERCATCGERASLPQLDMCAPCLERHDEWLRELDAEAPSGVLPPDVAPQAPPDSDG